MKRKSKRTTPGSKRLRTLENRRRRAARLFERKKKQAEVARILGVSRQSVSRWHQDWCRGGKEALKGAERLGRKPRLDSAQLERIEEELLKGARAHGFSSALWTLKRIATIIERVTGVRYHPGHVWKILGQMGWSLQKPAKRAKERNEAGVKEWIAETWTAVKKKPAEKAAGSSSRTKAGSPKNRRSAERGHPKGKRRS